MYMVYQLLAPIQIVSGWVVDMARLADCVPVCLCLCLSLPVSYSFVWMSVCVDVWMCVRWISRLSET